MGFGGCIEQITKSIKQFIMQLTLVHYLIVAQYIEQYNPYKLEFTILIILMNGGLLSN